MFSSAILCSSLFCVALSVCACCSRSPKSQSWFHSHSKYSPVWTAFEKVFKYSPPLLCISPYMCVSLFGCAEMMTTKPRPIKFNTRHKKKQTTWRQWVTALCLWLTTWDYWAPHQVVIHQLCIVHMNAWIRWMFYIGMNLFHHSDNWPGEMKRASNQRVYSGQKWDLYVK